MTRGLALALLAGVATLTGCPDNPYKASTWTKKLDDPREAERALTELKQLGDPSAIPAIGEAWIDQGRPVGHLQVMISLARPLTPEQAKAEFYTDYEKEGRKASWDIALPYLKKALLEVDETNPRSVDSAMKAAEAVGESRLEGGLEALIDLANKPVTKKLYEAQIGAIRAIGKFENNKQGAAGAITRIIERDPPPHPRTAAKDQKAATEEKFTLYLKVAGASINALADLRAPSATRTLVLAQYRIPELFTQIRRALVASGPTAKDELRKVIAGTHSEVNQLIKEKKLDKYCGDKGDAPVDQCQPVSAKEFYPVVVLGDFYDPATVPDLIAVLKRPPVPAYYLDEQPGPTQHNAVYDALGKIGSPQAADTIRDIWKGVTAPKKGEMAPAEFGSKLLAIVKYPFLTRDQQGVDELAKIAADNGADREAQFHDELRRTAAESFARLSRDPSDIRILNDLADKYFKASAEKRAAADGKPKQDADVADKEFEKQKKKLDEIKIALLKTTKDKDKTAADIKAATEATKKAETEFKEYKKKHRAAVQPYKDLDNFAKGYKQIARLFQQHIARIEVALRCKHDLDCFAKSLTMKPDDVAKNVAPYIKDIGKWTADEKVKLLEGYVERSMLEIGKAGSKASKYTETLLDHAKTDNRIMRQSILLALPKIATVPCNTCEAKLDAALKAGEGKLALADLQLETTMLRNYFSWAGGKTPSVRSSDAPAEKAAAPAEKEAAPAEEPEDKKPAEKPPAKAQPKKKGR